MAPGLAENPSDLRQARPEQAEEYREDEADLQHREEGGQGAPEGGQVVFTLALFVLYGYLVITNGI